MVSLHQLLGRSACFLSVDGAAFSGGSEGKVSRTRVWRSLTLTSGALGTLFLLFFSGSDPE